MLLTDVSELVCTSCGGDLSIAETIRADGW